MSETLSELLAAVQSQYDSCETNMSIRDGVANRIEFLGFHNFSQDVLDDWMEYFKKDIDAGKNYNTMSNDVFVRKLVEKYYKDKTYTVDVVGQKDMGPGRIGYIYRVMFDDNSYLESTYISDLRQVHFNVKLNHRDILDKIEEKLVGQGVKIADREPYIWYFG